MPHELFPFKFFDTISGRWVKARFKARREVIAATYPQGWEITGPPEIRDGGPPSSLVAGHLASTPSASETFPTDLFSGIDPERNDRGEG